MENQNNLTSKYQQNTYNEKLPQELAYKELGPKDKPPRKIPFLKIIIYAIVILLLGIILAVAIYLLRHQKVKGTFLTPEALISGAPIPDVPKPTANPCGYEAMLCPDGTLSAKTGPSCNFKECEEASMDMNKFWKISTDDMTRTYTNTDIGYSFQAPASWRFVGRDVGANLFSHTYKCKEVDADCTGANILLLTSVTTGKTDAIDWLSSKENYVFPNIKNPKGLPKITIGGLEAVKVKDGGTAETYVFIYNDTVFILSYGGSNGKEAVEAKKVYDQIISTIKFESINSKFCGGFAGVKCPENYKCKLDGNYPDAGGTCIEN